MRHPPPAPGPAVRRSGAWWAPLRAAPCPTCEDPGPHFVVPAPGGRAHVTCRGCHTARTVEEPRDGQRGAPGAGAVVTTTPRRRRNDELLAEVTARLGRVAGHMPPDAFAALVESVVEVTLKYEGYATPPAVERRRGPGEPPTAPDRPASQRAPRGQPGLASTRRVQGIEGGGAARPTPPSLRLRSALGGLHAARPGRIRNK